MNTLVLKGFGDNLGRPKFADPPPPPPKSNPPISTDREQAINRLWTDNSQTVNRPSTSNSLHWQISLVVRSACVKPLGLRHLLAVQLAIQENAQNLWRNIFRTSESSLSKIVWKLCVHTTFAQFFAQKRGSHTMFAQFFWVPWHSGWECPAHSFCTIFSARCNFLKSAAAQDRDVSTLGWSTLGTQWEQHADEISTPTPNHRFP